MTRAKKHLWLSYANSRYRFGQLVQNEPSRFIEEMPEEKLDKSSAGGGARNQSTTAGWGSAYDRMHAGRKNTSAGNTGSSVGSTKPSYLPVNPPTSVNKNHIPSANFVAADPSQLEAGMKVEHQKFGFGIIKEIEGSAHNPIAMILFDNNGEKKIMLNYAKLSIVPS